MSIEMRSTKRSSSEHSQTTPRTQQQKTIENNTQQKQALTFGICTNCRRTAATYRSSRAATAHLAQHIHPASGIQSEAAGDTGLSAAAAKGRRARLGVEMDCNQLATI